MSTDTSKIQVEGGSLQDRLKLLEEQRQRDTAKNTAAPSKAAIQIEGGGIQDRLKRLEETRQKEAEKLASSCRRTDPALVTEDLIRERLKWVQDYQNNSKNSNKAEIVVEGGGVEVRKQILEQQRQREAARLASNKNSGLEHVSDDLIQQRLAWMEEHANASAQNGSGSKAAIVVEGGNLMERLRLLEEQRRRQAERASGNQQTDWSQLSDQLIQERLQWIEEQQNQQEQQAKAGDTTVIKHGSLAVRKKLLAEQHRREAERLTVRRLVEGTSENLVSERMQWIQQKVQDGEKENDGTSSSLMSNQLISERMQWLKESAEKARALPEKERIEMTKHLVQQRKDWLQEQLQKAAQLPPKERIEVSQGLITERMEWLQQQMNQASRLSHKDRTQMTTDLIAERIYYLEAQIQAQSSNEEEKANLEMQVTFLEEQVAVAENMTEEEQLVMTNVLITEKLQDLEQQKDLIAEISDDQQIEVAQALIEDRQAWLEGDQEHYVRKREEQKREQEEAEARALEEQQTAARIAVEVANSIAFWTEQKNSAAVMSGPERAQITAFLMAEHIVGLEVQLEDENIDAETKESLEQQIAYLNDQLEIIDDVDHLMMIDLLVQEKVSNLEKMLEATGSLSVDV